MNEKPKYTIQEKSQYLLDQYIAIVTSVFPGITSIEEFFTAFNAVYVSYQDSNKRKMLPQSLKEGAISCSSAAAITGIWWFIVNCIEPTYFVEQVGRDSGSSKTGAHVVVGLPSAELSTKHETVDSAYLARGKGLKVPGVEVVDYTIKFGLTHALPALISEDTEKITGNYAYLMNRIRTLGLKSKDISNI